MNLREEVKKFAELQWRWILGVVFAVMGITQITMFLAISIFVARSSSAGHTPSYAEITQISETIGQWVGPFIFLSLAFFAALWLAIKVRVAPRLHGLVIGIILAFISLIGDFVFSPSLEWYEILFSGILVIPVGWLGGYRGETILKNREAVYRTSQAIRGVNRFGMVQAIGKQLAGPSVVLIALVDKDGAVDSDSVWASSNLPIPASIPTLRSTPELATVLTGKQLPQADSTIHSLLVLPLSNVNETLIVGSHSRVGFSRTSIQNYLTIAEQVALSLENLKLVEQARQAGISQERQRLAAEIHDGLTQGFISIVTHLEVAEAKMEKEPPEVRYRFQDLLNQIRQTARENLTAARKMTWALRPDLQKGVPLPDSLESLAKRWSSTNNIPVTFSYSGDLHQLHPDIETALLRTLREALNNIQKHADATQVTATLTYLDTLVALDVQDNGKGFSLENHSSADTDGGFGLKSLQEQAERLGGELSIESEVGKGSTIAIAIPESGREKS